MSFQKDEYEKGLVAKLKGRQAIIGVYGLGYVGLPLALRFTEVGFKVVGFDIDASKVQKLMAGESYIEHISASRIQASVKKGMSATTDFSQTKEVDALIFCVPTPLNRYREPDISYIVNTMEACLPHLRAGQVMSLESTTYPGTTEEELMPRIESRGFKIGENYFLVFSPEREDPGRENFNTQTIPKVCGGVTRACLNVGTALYQGAVDTVVPVSSVRVAEMSKLLENIHRAVNIGLVNEMKVVADKMGIDIHEVIRAAATKPFGFVPYQPGPGLGGHCIPIDPFYLTWKAREYGIHTRFIELAGEVNQQMPDFVVAKLVQGLNAAKKSLNGSRILVLGIAYKKNVDDMRESPSVQIMERLRAGGATVAYSDPHVPRFPRMREHHFDLVSVPLTEATLAEQDCVLLATDHDKFDYPFILKHARLVVDSRGKFQEHSSKLIRA